MNKRQVYNFTQMFKSSLFCHGIVVILLVIYLVELKGINAQEMFNVMKKNSICRLRHVRQNRNKASF